MISLTQVREAVAVRLASIDRLNAHARPPGSVTTPAAIVLPEPGTFLVFDSTFSRESDDIDLVVRILVAKADDRNAQEALDEYLAGSGDKSIKQAVETDADNDGLLVTAPEARNYGEYEIGGVIYLGCEVTIQIR